jgi:DNA polymerase-3 subunit gamma/tau
VVASGPEGSGSGAIAGGMDVAAIRRAWPDILGWIFKHKRTTWTLLSEHATVYDYDGSKVVLGISTVGIANTFRHGPHADLVRQALIDVLGVDARVEGIPTPDAGQSAPSGDSHPTVRSANRFPSDDPAVKGDSPAPAASRGSDDSGATGSAGGPAAYAGLAASSPPPETGGGWATASSGPSSGPSWASDDGAGAAAPAPEPAPAPQAEPGTGSRLAAAKAAVAAEAPARTPDTYVADDSAASADDEDIAELGEVGRPVIERLLGGKVIDEGP